MPLSPATLDAWVLKTAGNLEDHAAAVRDDLRNAEAVCADETGVNTSFKKNAFVHVACTDKVTLYHFGGRGIEDIKAGQVIDTLTGALVSDCYTAYNEMTSGLLRQWCLAHLIREAEYHEAYYTKPGPTSLEIGWQGIVEVLEEAISLRRENPGVVLPVGKPRSLLARRVRAALKIMEADTRKQAGRPRAYLQRLLGNPDRIFTFLEHPSVPPTNNLAEQALRPIKVKQNRSRVWRSLQGIETHLAVAGYLETCRKQGYNQAEGIKAALAGKALLPA
jgi:transposase